MAIKPLTIAVIVVVIIVIIVIIILLTKKKREGFNLQGGDCYGDWLGRWKTKDMTISIEPDKLGDTCRVKVVWSWATLAGHTETRVGNIEDNKLVTDMGPSTRYGSLILNMIDRNLVVDSRNNRTQFVRI